MYKVLYDFADLDDNKYLYHAGDEYPRSGLKVSDKRLKELSGTKNKQGKALIELVKEKETRANAEESTKVTKSKKEG